MTSDVARPLLAQREFDEAALHFVLPGALSKDAGRALSALLARRHEADYRLLVEVDQATWEAARAESATFAAATAEYLERNWPTRRLRIDGLSR